jgi:hypothetical protein
VSGKCTLTRVRLLSLCTSSTFTICLLLSFLNHSGSVHIRRGSRSETCASRTENIDMKCRRHARLPVQPPFPGHRRDHAAPDQTRTPQGRLVLSAGYASVLETSGRGHPDTFVVECARLRECASAVYAQRTRDTQARCRLSTNAPHAHVGRGINYHVQHSCPGSHSRSHLLHPTIEPRPPGHRHLPRRRGRSVSSCSSASA